MKEFLYIFVISYLSIGCLWNILFNSVLSIQKAKDDKPVNQFIVFLFSFYWIIGVPILLYKTKKYNESESEKDDM